MGTHADLTVGRLASLAGVTVRTLHHYDEIGLVTPSARTASGYRVYAAADVDRLRQVLTYRRLGFGLREIAQLVGDPGADAVAHLRRQRGLLMAQRDQADAMVAAIDKELEARTMGMQLTPEEQLEVFGTDKVGGEWADEARERWGDTEEWRQSQSRTAAYTKDDWARMKAKTDETTLAFVSARRAGAPADGPAAMDAAERHRQHISRYFYDCGYEMHACMARLYVTDPRFTATYDEVEPGLARYVHDAIMANAARAGA
ncbi:MAG: MerR family transcriptional regulator [Streptosporangiales bacterium]|nr:MerR family transcriptional regulator [Streptosporangiales bacterium]